MPVSTPLPKLYNGKDVKAKWAVLFEIGSSCFKPDTTFLSRVFPDTDKTPGKGENSMEPA